MSMLRPVLTLLAGIAAAIPALAQTPVTDDLTPTVSPDRYRICNDRPARPDWVENIPPREAYQALTLMGLYELRAWQAIIASGSCACAIRFPDWAIAEAEYSARFADLPAAEHTQIQRELRAEAQDLRAEVRDICEVEGNW
jgi:hypothetical protein